jgi:nucleoside-diphosphate-sugar epimerase
MTSVMLTGASGFIGRQCLAVLQSKGYEVHAVSRQRLAWPTSPDTYWHQVDLLTLGSPTDLISRVKPTLLLHLAWCATPGSFWVAPENVEWIRASLELLTAFAKHNGKRVTVAGSCTEYDWTAGECAEDTALLKPSTLYGTSKDALAKVLHSWSGTIGLSHAWGRIFHLYGPFEHPSRLVAYGVRCLLEGRPALCSGGSQIHDFSYVEDVAGALVTLLEAGVQGPVNIGSGTPVAVRDVLSEIGRQIGRPDLLRFGARDSDPETARIWANTQRLSKEVGWSPRYDLTSGIEQTIEWWRKKITTAGMPFAPENGCV